MPANLGGWTGIILLVIILLLFGANKLPALAKGMGQSLKIFKNEIKTPLPDDQADANAQHPQAQQQAGQAHAAHQATQSQAPQPNMAQAGQLPLQQQPPVFPEPTQPSGSNDDGTPADPRP